MISPSAPLVLVCHEVPEGHRPRWQLSPQEPRGSFSETRMLLHTILGYTVRILVCLDPKPVAYIEVMTRLRPNPFLSPGSHMSDST